jgi:hypothetical protein
MVSVSDDDNFGEAARLGREAAAGFEPLRRREWLKSLATTCGPSGSACAAALRDRASFSASLQFWQRDQTLRWYSVEFERLRAEGLVVDGDVEFDDVADNEVEITLVGVTGENRDWILIISRSMDRCLACVAVSPGNERAVDGGVGLRAKVTVRNPSGPNSSDWQPELFPPTIVGWDEAKRRALVDALKKNSPPSPSPPFS